jgi:peptidoglycan/LPS O-acetylase OafA/YrhL
MRRRGRSESGQFIGLGIGLIAIGLAVLAWSGISQTEIVGRGVGLVLLGIPAGVVAIAIGLVRRRRERARGR